MLPLVVLTALALGACGGGNQTSTLPPAPEETGTVALRYLRHDPEVYADATIQTVGSVGRSGDGGSTLYVLEGAGGGVRIVLEPTRKFARYLGRRVRVRGTFTVSFAVGYEILASGVALANS